MWINVNKGFRVPISLIQAITYSISERLNDVPHSFSSDVSRMIINLGASSDVNYHNVWTSFHTFMTPVPTLQRFQQSTFQFSLGILTYFACSTWSSGTHRATSGLIESEASESSGANERLRCLALCSALIFPRVDKSDLCCNLGGSFPPPFSNTHWTRYVFRMCEKTWTTSPAGLGCAIRITSVSLVSSPSPLLPGLKCSRGFELEKEGSTSKSLRRSAGISATLAAVADAPEILGTVGNSYSPARSPGSPNYERYQSVSCAGSKTCVWILTSFWTTDE